jgi:hypothetical protein
LAIGRGDARDGVKWKWGWDVVLRYGCHWERAFMDSKTDDQEGDEVGYQEYGVCFAAANVGLAKLGRD